MGAGSAGRGGRKKPRKPGRPPGSLGEATREAILDAALEAFAEVGFGAMSVRKLTRQLGVSHNLVHHYFGSKQELWQAAIDYGLGRKVVEVLEMMGAPAELADPVETARKALRHFILISARVPSVARILAREAAEESDRLDYIYDRYGRSGFALGTRFAERLRGTAGGKEVDLRSLSLLITTGATALFAQAPLARKLGGPDPFSEEGIERHLDTIVRVIFEGILAPAVESGSSKGS